MNENRKLFLIIILLTAGQLCFSQQQRLAILDFQVLVPHEDQKKYEWMSPAFAESLTDAFSRVSIFSVIERTRLSKVIDEQRLQHTKSFDTSSVVSAGKLLGVSKILLGSCQVITGHLMVNMRIVDVETGKIEPLEQLPIIRPVDSVLYMQKEICVEILKQYNAFTKQNQTAVTRVTSASTKNSNAYEMLSKGIAFYNRGQYEDALAMYNTALKYDRFYGKAYFRRGQAHTVLERYDEALQDFERSDTYLDKDTLYVLMSDVYYRQGDFEKSAEFLQKARKINPNNYSVRANYQKVNIARLQKNTVVVPVDSTGYERTFEFLNGIAKVMKKGKYGFINTKDELVVPLQFDEVKEFAFGRAAVKMNGKWGYIDDYGTIVIEPIYSSAENFRSNYFAEVRIRNKAGVIDNAGNVVLPLEFSFIRNWTNDDHFIASRSKSLGFKELWGVYDLKGKELIPTMYNSLEKILRHETDLYSFKAELDGKWGLVNNRNEIILPFRYENSECIRPFKNGYAATKVNEKWGFVNLKGEQVIPHMYERVNDRSNKHFEVKEKGQWGLVDSGNIVKLSVEYEDIIALKNGYWGLKKNKLWGVADSTGKIIIDFQYEAMGNRIPGISIIYNITPSNLSVIVSKNGKVYYINENNKCIYDCP